MPIRTRLALLFVAGIAAVATIGGFVFVHTISNGLRSSIVTTLQTRADAISQQLPEAGSGQQQGPGQSSSIGNVDENDSITQLIGSNSQVTAASGLGTAAPLLTSAQLTQARHQGL
ncbi:MAG: hypothetical protein ACRDYB_13615, partial [Acidimicrobiales bacterium]